MWGKPRSSREPWLRLAVDGGRVGCPRGEDVDIEECLACGYLVDLDEDAGPSVVHCRFATASPAPVLDMFDRRWRSQYLG